MKANAPHSNGNGSSHSNGRANGNGTSQGHSQGPTKRKPATKARAAKMTPKARETTRRGLAGSRRTAANAASQPRYDRGLRFDTPGLRYASADPVVVPVNDGGKVKLELQVKSDTELVNFTYAHIEDMTGNENFLTPEPSDPEFKALADAFADAVTAKKSAENLAKEATAARDAARLALELAFTNKRAPYVQGASNGNTEVILSSGLPVRNPRKPTGDLPPPLGLHAELNGTPGVMQLIWNAVAKARGYSIQYSKADTMERDWKLLATVNKKQFSATGLEIGKAYAFRVAANGGASGQSFWSVEVVRTAA